jgi:hypothetical protein
MPGAAPAEVEAVELVLAGVEVSDLDKELLEEPRPASARSAARPAAIAAERARISAATLA